MSKSYLPYKDIRKKIEGVDNETSSRYQSKAQLSAIPQIDKDKMSQYFDRDYVVDDDIVPGYLNVSWVLGNGVSYIEINGEKYYESGEVKFLYDTEVTWKAYPKTGYTMNEPYEGSFTLVKDTVLPTTSAEFGKYSVKIVFNQGIERIRMNNIDFWAAEYPEGYVITHMTYDQLVRWQAFPEEAYLCYEPDNGEFRLYEDSEISPTAYLKEFDLTFEINQGVEKIEVNVKNDVPGWERDETFTYTEESTVRVSYKTVVTWKTYAKEGYLIDSGLNEQDDDTITVGSKIWTVIAEYKEDTTLSPEAILKEYNIPVNVNQGVSDIVVTIKNSVPNYERDETINVYSTKTLTARWSSQVLWTATTQSGYTFNNDKGTNAESDKYIYINTATDSNTNVIHEYVISPVTKIRTYKFTINLNQGVKNINVKYLNETDNYPRDEQQDYTNTYDWGSGLTTGGVDTRVIDVSHFTKIVWVATAATGYTMNNPSTGEITITNNASISPTSTLNEYDLKVVLNQGCDHIDLKFENGIQNYTRNESVTDTNSTPRTGNSTTKTHKVRHFTKISGSCVAYTGFHWTTQTHPKIDAFTPQETDVNTPTTITFLYDSLTGADTFSPVTTINTYTVNFKLGQGVVEAVVNLKNSVDNYTQDKDVTLTSSANVTGPDPKQVTEIVQHYTVVQWGSAVPAVGYTIVTQSGTFSNSLTTGATYTVTPAKLNEYDLLVTVNQGVQSIDLNIKNTITGYERDENMTVTATKTVKVHHYSDVKYGVSSATGYHLGSDVYTDPVYEDYTK